MWFPVWISGAHSSRNTKPYTVNSCRFIHLTITIMMTRSTTKISGSCFGITHSSIMGFTKAHSSVPTMRQTATQPNWSTRCSVTNGQLHRRTNGCNSSLLRKPAMRMSTNIMSYFTGFIINVTCLPIHTRNWQIQLRNIGNKRKRKTSSSSWPPTRLWHIFPKVHFWLTRLPNGFRWSFRQTIRITACSLKKVKSHRHSKNRCPKRARKCWPSTLRNSRQRQKAKHSFISKTSRNSSISWRRSASRRKERQAIPPPGNLPFMPLRQKVCKS